MSVFEITINIKTPELVQAMQALAASLARGQAVQETTTIPAASAVPVAPTVPAAPTAVPVTPAPAPAATEAPAAVPAMPAVPVTAPSYTLDQLTHAGAALVDAGKMDQLQALLAKYGVVAVVQVPKEQYGAFAADLRALGAQL